MVLYIDHNTLLIVTYVFIAFCDMVYPINVVLYCIVLYYEALHTEGRLDRYSIGIPRELSEIRTQPWLSEGSLTCDP